MNSSRVHLERTIQTAAESLPEGALVLDAGAGDCRYSRHFARQRYESMDFAQVGHKSYGELTFVCDITSIPVDEGRYDFVLLSQVLAHLPDPGAALRELGRVLRPGGTLLLTAPLFFQENEQPHDYYRYTQFGLRHLLETAGFEVESLTWLEGYAGTLAYQLGTAARALRPSPSRFGGGVLGVGAAAVSLLMKPVFAGLAWLYARCDVRHADCSTGHCKNYVVQAARRR